MIKITDFTKLKRGGLRAFSLFYAPDGYYIWHRVIDGWLPKKLEGHNQKEYNIEKF